MIEKIVDLNLHCHCYNQNGAYYFYKSRIHRILITAVFDVCDFVWRNTRQLSPFVPAWKSIFLFSLEDYEKNIPRIVKFMSSASLGKILELRIGNKTYIMLLVYHVGTERTALHLCYYPFEVNFGHYITAELKFSKKIGVHSFISQGEGYHREEIPDEKKQQFFTGENYYRYGGVFYKTF